MRDREERIRCAHRREPAGGAAVKLETRWPAGPNDLDVPPQDVLRMPRAERLHARFFRREPTREVNGCRPAACAVRDFRVGENAADEPIAVTLDRCGDAVDFRSINTQTNDV